MQQEANTRMRNLLTRMISIINYKRVSNINDKFSIEALEKAKEIIK